MVSVRPRGPASYVELPERDRPTIVATVREAGPAAMPKSRLLTGVREAVPQPLDGQAGHVSHISSLVCHPPAGGESRHPNPPGTPLQPDRLRQTLSSGCYAHCEGSKDWLPTAWAKNGPGLDCGAVLHE